MIEERENICLNCIYRRKYEWQNKSGYGREWWCIRGKARRVKKNWSCSRWQDDINALREW